MTEYEIKKTVRRRDGCCVRCGMTDRKHRTLYRSGLQVHRIIPGEAYTVVGCETLCIGCHGKKPRTPIPTVAMKIHFVFDADAAMWLAIRTAAMKKSITTGRLIESVIRKGLARHIRDAAERIRNKKSHR